MLTTVEIPSIYCPFPVAINPLVETVQEQTDIWVKRWQLVTDEVAYQRYCACHFAHLTARAYPTTGLDELLIASEWFTLLFLLDDPVDEDTVGTKAERLRQVFDGLLYLLCNNEILNTSYGPLAASWAELWHRIQIRTSPAWQQRFIASVAHYFDGCIWEADNRASKQVPTLADYRYWRPFTSAIYTTFDLIDITEHIDLPDTVRDHEVLKRLSFMANNVISWYNDLISLPKEIKHGDVQNLVLIVQHEESLSLQDGIYRVAKIHDDEVRTFITLAEMLPDFGRYNTQVQRYVDILRYWMSGNVDWSNSALRYQPSANVPQEGARGHIDLLIDTV